MEDRKISMPSFIACPLLSACLSCRHSLGYSLLSPKLQFKTLSKENHLQLSTVAANALYFHSRYFLLLLLFLFWKCTPLLRRGAWFTSGENLRSKPITGWRVHGAKTDWAEKRRIRRKNVEILTQILKRIWCRQGILSRYNYGRRPETGTKHL